MIRRTIPRSRLLLKVHRSVHHFQACCTPLRRSYLSGSQRKSPPLQVQYTQFSNGYTDGRRPGRDKRPKFLIFIAAMGTVYFVAHLEQVPETGRWRFMDASPWYEAMLQKASYDTLLSDFQRKILPAHHPTTRHVHRIVADLLEASDLGSLRSIQPRKPPTEDGFSPDDDDSFFALPPGHHPSPDRGGKDWNLLVVDDPDIVNAVDCFNTIVIFTGILPVCRDDAGLAAVVSHEIGHAVARHASERQSLSKILVLAALLLHAAGIDLGLARLLNYLLFELPNSRKQELEADTIGMRIAAKACYDPKSAVDMHVRLAKASESGDLGFKFEFLRTHPLPEHRIKNLEDLVPEGYEVRATSPRCAGIRESIDHFLGGMSRWG